MPEPTIAPRLPAGVGGLSETECGETVMWWDGEYDGNCQLTKGHDGHHHDGLSCFDEAGEEVHCETH